LVKTQEIDEELLRRKIAKSIVYRIFSIICCTILIHAFFISDLIETFIFVLILEGLKTLGYFIFELFWEKLKRFWNLIRGKINGR